MISLKNRLKKTLFFLLFYSRILDISLKNLTKKSNNFPCIIIVYHRIVDDHTFYLNKGPVVHHHINDFQKEILYLEKNYQILSLDNVVRCLKSGLPLEKPTVSITFDDGYLDNYTLAYPVLRKYKIPATIYLTTSLIGTEERTWTDQIELALLQTEKTSLFLPSLLGTDHISTVTTADKEKANTLIAELLKIRPETQRRELLVQLFEALGYNESLTFPGLPRIMLNWQEVHEMAENGITIGSHSHSHPILSRMPVHQAKNDIATSKRVIEQELGTRVKHFAFPNGREQDFSDDLRNYCRQIGFESVASVLHGSNSATHGSPFELRRIGAMSPIWMFAGQLLLLLHKSQFRT